MNNWIWINEDDCRRWEYDPYNLKHPLTMAEFKREYFLNGNTTLKICADTRYELYIDNELIGRGPASPGGDFMAGADIDSLKYCYYDEYKIKKHGKVEIRAVVSSIPTALNEYTFEHPGLWIELYEKNKKIGGTDESWQCRELYERISSVESDYSRTPASFKKPYIVKYDHKIKKSPLEHLSYTKIVPQDFKKMTGKRGETITLKLDLPKIYSAYTEISIKCQGRVKVKITTEELDGVGRVTEEIVTNKDVVHISQRMFSVGQVTIELRSSHSRVCEIDAFALHFVHYPVKNEPRFNCSDSFLNKLYDVCMHTLKICRQSTHLDSPTHQEPLACTGDYYIQALMEYLNIYDPTLTAFDIYRTAERLKYADGFMFHTSYSLMFPMWLYDYYQFTGDKKLLSKTKSAMRCLYSRFKAYTDKKNGLLEKAPNYMFVDWIVMKDAQDPYGDAKNMMSHGQIDGFSLHHPPKSLGQSALCMFYYQALITGAKLYRVMENEEMALTLENRAKSLKEAINTHLFDKEKGLYIGGLTTPDKTENDWLPKNTKRAFYLKQSNVLAVLFGIAKKEDRVSILDYVCRDLRKEEMQPYFYHFLLEALYNEGLFSKYGFKLIDKYKSLIERSEKGLSEAWEYINCDCSHAWGGTPAYILKKAISGFEILENGYKKIRLSPNLYGLDFASFNISTPYGDIDIKLQKGKKMQIVAPKEIEIVM